MALNEPRLWLICYDIAAPRRLKRLHRFLKSEATPVQYSVFLFRGSAMQLGRLVKEIETYIDEKVDDVRVYQVPAAIQCDVLGRGRLPEGVTLVSDRAPDVAAVLAPSARWYDAQDDGAEGESSLAEDA